MQPERRDPVWWLQIDSYWIVGCYFYSTLIHTGLALDAFCRFDENVCVTAQVQSLVLDDLQQRAQQLQIGHPASLSM